MISVIIVTYNSRRHIARCLNSLQDSDAEIVVVDNASVDGTAALIRESFPKVHLIASPRNLGFAAASNLGARQSAGDALLFLNPDVISPGPLSALEEALDSRPGVAAVAPRLTNAQGRAQVGFNVRRFPTAAALIFEILLVNRLFPKNAVNRNFRCLDLDLDRVDAQPFEVEQPAAACLLVRRVSFERVKGFDEKFFPLWFEDLDLCLRLRSGGEKILFWPQITFQHAGGHSVESITFPQRQVYWYGNLLYYVNKHFGWPVRIGIRTTLLCGLGLRILAEIMGLDKDSRSGNLGRSEKVRGYLRAARLAFLGRR